jgi:hypothetical protein
VGSGLLGVIFCLNFSPFFFSSLVPLPSVFPLFIYLGYAKTITLSMTVVFIPT